MSEELPILKGILKGNVTYHNARKYNQYEPIIRPSCDLASINRTTFSIGRNKNSSTEWTTKKTLYQSHTRTMTWLQMPCIESKMKKKKQHREWNVCSIEHDLNLQPTKDPNIVLIALFRQYTIKFVLLLIWSIPMYTQTHTLSRKRDREKRLSKDFWNILWTHLNRESVYEFNLNMIREACVCVCVQWPGIVVWDEMSFLHIADRFFSLAAYSKFDISITISPKWVAWTILVFVPSQLCSIALQLLLLLSAYLPIVVILSPEAIS